MFSSLGKKYLMGLTGIFLVSFLLVHCGLNSLIFINDGGVLFNKAAHFMATNVLIRVMEIGLFLGVVLHILDALVITLRNRKARPVGYMKTAGSANSTWYSRSMMLLGSAILFFLVIHLIHFWVKSRFTGLGTVQIDGMEYDNLYEEMRIVFSNPIWVVVYVLCMLPLGYHLLHGFQSAFQSFGLNHKKYTPIIKTIGMIIAVILPLVFAAMPIFMFLLK